MCPRVYCINQCRRNAAVVVVDVLDNNDNWFPFSGRVSERFVRFFPVYYNTIPLRTQFRSMSRAAAKEDTAPFSRVTNAVRMYTRRQLYIVRGYKRGRSVRFGPPTPSVRKPPPGTSPRSGIIVAARARLNNDNGSTFRSDGFSRRMPPAVHSNKCQFSRNILHV